MLFYIVYYDVYCCYCGVCIEKYMHSVFHRCVSELHGHLCPHRNVLPEVVYCCFTSTALFTKLFTYLYDQSLRLLSHQQVLFTLYLMVSEIAKCIA